MPKYNDFDLDLQNDEASVIMVIPGPVYSGRPSCDPVPQCAYTVYLRLCD